MTTVIDRFYIPGQGHNPLSNFYIGEPFVAPHWSYPDGPVYVWLTSEHYYQAAKFTTPVDFLYVRDARSPGESKRRGREKLPSFNPAWDAICIPVMRQALALKFHPSRGEAQYLLNTGDAMLIEGNTWGDRMWGAEKGPTGEYTDGQNWLGLLLMAQRAILRAQMLVPRQEQLDV